MRRRMVIGLSLLAMAIPAWAQGGASPATRRGPVDFQRRGQMGARPANGQQRGRSARMPKVTGPRNKDECRVEAERAITLLGLEGDQKAVADAMVEEYMVALEQQPDMTLIAQLAGDLRNKQAAGDKEGAEKIRQQLIDLMPVKKCRREFFEKLESTLTDAQKEKLTRIKKFLEVNPLGKARPIDVFNAAVKLADSTEMRKTIDAVHCEFVEQMMHSTYDMVKISQSGIEVDFAKAILKALPADKQAKFKEELAWVMPELDKPETAETPATE